MLLTELEFLQIGKVWSTKKNGVSRSALIFVLSVVVQFNKMLILIVFISDLDLKDLSMELVSLILN